MDEIAKLFHFVRINIVSREKIYDFNREEEFKLMTENPEIAQNHKD